MKAKHAASRIKSLSMWQKVLCVLMAASLLLLMVPNGLRANAEQATETIDAQEATLEETQSDENAEEVTNEADDFTYDENNEAIENGKEYIAEESSQPNFEDFAINIEIDGTGSFYGEITSLFSGAEWSYPSTNPQTSATDPYPEIIAEMGDDIYFDEDWSCFSINENNHLVWMYFTDSDYYSGDIIPTTIEGKTPVWYCGSTKITEDDTYFNDQSYTFTLVYEGEDPGNVTVTVDLDGGEITTAESEVLTAAGWNLESDNTWTQEFESGTKTEAEAMTDWEGIEPNKGDLIFDAWAPVPTTESLTEAKTFTATYTETPEDVTVTVDLDDGEITAAESEVLTAAGWNLESDNTWTQEFESGTKTEAEAMTDWEGIEPTKGTSTFKAWDPVPGTTSVTADKTFKATYEEEPAEILNVKIDATEGSFSGEGVDYGSSMYDYDIESTTSFTDPYLSDPDSFTYESDEDIDGFWVDDEDNTLNYAYSAYDNDSNYVLMYWSISAKTVQGKVPVWTVNGDVLEPGETCGFVADTMNTVELSYAEPSVFHTVTVDLTAEGYVLIEPNPEWTKSTEGGTTTYTKDFAANSDIEAIIHNFARTPMSTSEYHHTFDGWIVEPYIEKLTEDVTYTATFFSKMKPTLNFATTGPSVEKQGTFDIDVSDEETGTIYSASNKTFDTDPIIKEHYWNDNDCFSIDEDGVITYIYWFIDEYYNERTCEGTIWPDKTIDFQFKNWTLNDQEIACDGQWHNFRDYIIRDAEGKIPTNPEFDFIATFEESPTFTIEGRVTKEFGGDLANVNVGFVVDGETVASDTTDNYGWYELLVPKNYTSGILVADPGQAQVYYDPCREAFELSNITSDITKHFQLKSGKPVFLEACGHSVQGHKGFEYLYMLNGKVVTNYGNPESFNAWSIVPGASYELEGDSLVFTWNDDQTNAINKYYITPVSTEGFVVDSWTMGDQPFSPGVLDSEYSTEIRFEVHYTDVVAYNLTINYVDDSGNALAEPYVASVPEQSTYSVESPVIEGYELVDPAQSVVSGIMPAEDLTINVVYKVPAPVTPVEEIAAQTGDNAAVPFAVIGLIVLAGVCYFANRRVTLNR